MLTVQDLTTTYGPVCALDNVTVQVPLGQITAVLGANGAGKTSLLRTISGLVRPRSGRVLLDGEDVTRVRPEDLARRGISHVPEGRGVVAELTVEENLRLGGLFRKDRADAARALRDMYELFPPLAERRSRSAHTLSGGERQMLAIGRALVARPRVLLLDELSLGLAPKITAQIMALLRDLVAGQQLAVLLVEQNARSALSIADQGIVLGLGKVITTQPAAELASDVALRHAYLGF